MSAGAAAIDDAVLMTLAGIAYGAPGSIAHYLDEAGPTHGVWSVAWLAAPPSPPVNFAYIARNRLTGAHVLAIRGTYPDPFSAAYWDDADQDSPFGDMVAWPGAEAARISAGTAEGLAGVRGLQDSGGTSLPAFVAGLPAGTALAVTGHSLGGTLAPVVALTISQSRADLDLSVVSFAGMTPGDGGFAALFGAGSPLAGRVRRVFNTLDTVSYGWDRVWATHDFYQPAPEGGLVVAAMLLATTARLGLGGYDYAAVGTPVPLDGVVRPPSVACGLVAYVFETLHQHMPDTYLGLLGAPPLPFSILFGTIVAPRDRTAAATPGGSRLPVVYA